MSLGSIPARLIASCEACDANCDVYSPEAALCLCLIPVREVIHSSDMSTIFSRSALVRTISGYERLVPRMPALTWVKKDLKRNNCRSKAWPTDTDGDGFKRRD